MKRPVIATVLAVLLLTACTPKDGPGPIDPAGATRAPAPPTVAPPVEGPDPSYSIAAFYYPWYGNPTSNGRWIHWNDPNFAPPQQIASDLYPQLGAYSSDDPLVVAQHMAWLRRAGVGVIISSWWGRDTHEDQVVPLLLTTAQRYGIKVAFHLEPYGGRSAERLVEDIKYLYQKYGSSPAFFRSTTATRFSPGSHPKGVFFVWCAESAVQTCGKQPANAAYWRSALDAIHALPGGGALVIGNTEQAAFVRDGHFDGLYNYLTLHPDRDGGFDWARELPPGSLYVPSVMPGSSAVRVGYPSDTLVARDGGQIYDDQWGAALGTSIRPDLVTITSFNEWHEGTAIEPAAVGVTDGQGNLYADFGPLPADGYLARTRQWVADYLASSFPTTHRVRIRVRTTSDWTNVDVVSGGRVLRPDRVSVSSGAARGDLENLNRFVLTQPLGKAVVGTSVEMVYDVLLTGLDPNGKLELSIERGDIGGTRVDIYNYLGSTPVSVGAISWTGIKFGQKSFGGSVPSNTLLKPL